MMPQPTRILIVDDHQIVRAGLTQFIVEQADLTVAAEAATGDEAIRLIRQQDFDVVILDIAMPDKNGIDTLRIIKQLKPELHVLVLSGYPETHYAVNVLRAGANGYLSKNAPPEEMLRAIRIVARGRRYLSEAAADLVSEQLKRPTEQKMQSCRIQRWQD